MEYIDAAKIEHVTVTFENFDSCDIDAQDIESMAIHASEWPVLAFEEVACRYETSLCLKKSIYSNNLYAINRILQYRDITWFDVYFKDSQLPSLQWCIAWEDDPEHEDENRCQTIIQHANGVSIHIRDYGYAT